MKLSCNREKFSQAFQLAASVTATRDTKPVLQNVKITATQEQVLLQATDTEIGIRLEVEGSEVLEPGEAILPTRRFKMILQESADETLSIETDGEKAIVSGERSRFNLSTQAADDFPEVDAFAETEYYVVSGKMFREMIKRTIFATDEENTRYTLGGTLIEFGGTSVAAVATDGRRLAFQEGAPQSVVGDAPASSAIFPPKSLHLIERSVGEGTEEVKVAVSATRAIMQCNRAMVFTRLIEGKFPNWRKIIPTTDGKSHVDLSAGALLTAVRQAAIVASEKQPGVRFELGQGKLELFAQGAEIGDSRIELPVAFDGEACSLRLDPRFVIDFLRVLESEKNVTMFVAPDQPAFFRTDDGYSYVVMPLS